MQMSTREGLFLPSLKRQSSSSTLRSDRLQALGATSLLKRGSQSSTNLALARDGESSPKGASAFSDVSPSRWQRTGLGVGPTALAQLESGRLSPKGEKDKESPASALARQLLGSRPMSPLSPPTSPGGRAGQVRESLQAASELVLTRPTSRGSELGRPGSRGSTGPGNPNTSPVHFFADQRRQVELAEDPKPRLLIRRGVSGLTVNTGCGTPSLRSSLPLKGIQSLKEEEKIFDLFYWNEVLQEEGDGGKVVVCTAKRNIETVRKDLKYVMKMRSKESLQSAGIEEQFRQSQVKLLNLPPHNGVLPLQEVLEDEKFYYVVMERATGGSFFAGLLSEFEDGNMPAGAVRQLMRGILEGVGHVHQQGMLHRDIKPDNLVMHFRDDPGSPTGRARKVALIDFDHADPDWSPKCISRQDFCGTARFSAPETFLGFFSQSSDLYSVGVILYLLVSGKMPFDDKLFFEELNKLDKSPKRGTSNPMSTLHDKLRDEKIDWSCAPWPDQPKCREVCQKLLAFDAADRFASVEEVLAHPWFVEETVPTP